MAAVGLIIKSSLGDAADVLAAELMHWARREGQELLVEAQTAQRLGWGAGLPAAELVSLADPVVSLGGDGTLISVARLARGEGPLFFGVNFGRLGMLTELAPPELLPCLDAYLAGELHFETRSMLTVTVHRGGRQLFKTQAVNDAVVQKGSQDRLMFIEVSVGKEEVFRIAGDGVIFSTPTGSTAYSLSAGGSIVHPQVNALLVTPICPHSLSARPLILPAAAPVAVRVPAYDGSIFLLVDGQVSYDLSCEDEVIMTETESRVRLVRSPSQSYFGILRAKLNWGVANHGW